MVTVGLLFRLSAKWDKEGEVARYMEESLPTALDGLPEGSWLAMRFDTTSFGVLATFSDAAAEQEHVGERVATALREIAPALEATPAVQSFDVIAPKVPV
jgi:hypothetical protein